MFGLLAVAGLAGLSLMGNPPRRRRKGHRRNPQPVYRLANGDVVTAPQLRQMFMGKIPAPASRRLLGITRVKAARKNPGIDTRQGPPRVVRAPEYAVGSATLYAIAGTPYGYLHRTDGSIRVWKTRSGAAKELAKRKRQGLSNPLRPSRNGVLGSRRDALLILDWHGGQSSDCYRVGSNWLAGKKVPADAVMECYNELVIALKLAEDGKHNTAKDRARLRRLVGRLGRHYHPMALESYNPRRRARKTRR